MTMTTTTAVAIAVGWPVAAVVFGFIVGRGIRTLDYPTEIVVADEADCDDPACCPPPVGTILDPVTGKVWTI